MDFSKGRMAALRLIYFLVALGALFVAKVRFGLSDQIFFVLVAIVLIIIIVSYPIQMKLVYSVAYKEKKLGPGAMIGLEGSAIENLSPHGKVKVRGEIWRARTDSDPIRKGDGIIVLGVEDNLTLLVDSINSNH